jgi:hypothetical protein
MKVHYRLHEGIYTFYCVDDNGKELQVPKEQCNEEELINPSQYAGSYWDHYGINRYEFYNLTNFQSPS